MIEDLRSIWSFNKITPTEVKPGEVLIRFEDLSNRCEVRAGVRLSCPEMAGATSERAFFRQNPCELEWGEGTLPGSTDGVCENEMPTD